MIIITALISFCSVLASSKTPKNAKKLSPLRNKFTRNEAFFYKSRKLEAWMDPTLPLPHSIHQLGQHKRKRSTNRVRMLDGEGEHPKSPEILPLFPGYGTHYAYVYVGTPPQRQSVIIDTGNDDTKYQDFQCFRS